MDIECSMNRIFRQENGLGCRNAAIGLWRIAPKHRCAAPPAFAVVPPVQCIGGAIPPENGFRGGIIGSNVIFRGFQGGEVGGSQGSAKACIEHPVFDFKGTRYADVQRLNLAAGQGNPRQGSAAAVVNVFLDLLFVAGMNMGAGGAAIATEISELISLIWAFVYLKKHQPGMLTLNPQQYKIHGPTAKTVLKIGIPSSFQYLFIDLSFVFVNSIINSYGVIAASAVAVGSKVVNLSQTGISALSTGVGTMAGQNIGANKPERADKTIRVGVRCALVVAIVMFAMIQAIPGPLVKLFNREPAALEESIRCLRYLSIMAFPSAFFFIYVAIATASGFTVFSMFCHVLDGVVVRVALSLLLTRVFGMGLVGVYLGMGLAPTLSAIFAGAYFYSGAWKKRKLLEQNP